MLTDSATSLPTQPPPLRLCVPNVLASVETARQAVRSYLEGAAISPRAMFRLELVLEESLMNRVWHAFPQGGSHDIELQLSLQPDTLALCVEDEGIAFDPLQAPPRQTAATLAEAEPGGLGLLLTRRSALSCAYERRDGRNRFTAILSRQ